MLFSAAGSPVRWVHEARQSLLLLALSFEALLGSPSLKKQQSPGNAWWKELLREPAP